MGTADKPSTAELSPIAEAFEAFVVTSAAAAKLNELLAEENEPGLKLRVFVTGGGCSGFTDGLYCGGDYIQGDPNTLYRCSGGDLSVEQVCSNGCEVMPTNVDDQCY